MRGKRVIAATAGTTLLALGPALVTAPSALAAGHPRQVAVARFAVTTVQSLVPARSGILPPKNPGRSLRPNPNFLASVKCATGKDTRSCNALVLKAVANARKKLEKIRGMSFSLTAYEKLTRIEQLFVTANLERTARGLAPVTALIRMLNKDAQSGAVKDADPMLSVPLGARQPGGWIAIGWGANWAGGYDNPLGSDYGWMYDDGLGSNNFDCTKTHRSGCWGHRDNILGTFATKARCAGMTPHLVMGAGFVQHSKFERLDSETQLFVGVCGNTPPGVVLTWAKAKRLLHIKG